MLCRVWALVGVGVAAGPGRRVPTTVTGQTKRRLLQAPFPSRAPLP